MKYTVEKIGHADEIAKGNWCYGVKDGHKVVLTVNHLNPFDGNMDAKTVAENCAQILNETY